MGNTVRIRNGMSNATEGDILGNASDIIKDLGVVDLAGGHLLVTEDSPKGMTVQVAGGIVYVPNSNYDELDSDTTKFYPVVCSSEVLTIDNNVSGSTRIDIVCVKVDKTIAPDADASNIASKVVVKGTPGAGIPTTPANHYKLAEIEVANGETEITNALITDTREQVLLDGTLIDINSTITSSTSTDLTGYLYGDGSNVGTKGTEGGWIPAGETWEYVSVDDPTGIFRVNADVTAKYSAGMRVKMTNGGNVIYGIITVVGAYSGGYTNITFLHQIDPSDNLALYLLANSAITLPYYSNQKAPTGFPASPLSWSIISTPGNFAQANATSGTWYEAANITLPIGVWDFSYRGNLEHARTAGGSIKCYLGAVISETSANGTAFQSQVFYEYFRTPDATVYVYNFYQGVSGRILIDLTAKDVFYFNVYDTHDDTATLQVSNMRFEAICAYL